MTAIDTMQSDTLSFIIIEAVRMTTPGNTKNPLNHSVRKMKLR